MAKEVRFEVSCFDNVDSNDYVVYFKTKKEVEEYIQNDLEDIKRYFENYDYADFPNNYGGLTTEIWEENGDTYFQWVRKYSA